MDLVHDNTYVVYLRMDRRHQCPPHAAEEPLITCFSYAEARQIQKEYAESDRECVIRYEGVVGGGD